MKHVLLSVILAAAPVQLAAEDSDFEEGFGLLEKGAALMLQGLLAEIEPRLSELEKTLNEFNAYHPPEVLPNGDILIRRRTPLSEPEKPPEDGEIDL